MLDLRVVDCRVSVLGDSWVFISLGIVGWLSVLGIWGWFGLFIYFIEVIFINVKLIVLKGIF